MQNYKTTLKFELRHCALWFISLVSCNFVRQIPDRHKTTTALQHYKFFYPDVLAQTRRCFILKHITTVSD
ncbi:MAG: hypothetical protein OT643_07580 [Bacteroidetes bacterium]|nr:hypothetical protein [Chitinophagales bacterium]MDA0198623.1 hypothetical protein [Bacteroidota bacterium]